jgi:hypothetical protein
MIHDNWTWNKPSKIRLITNVGSMEISRMQACLDVGVWELASDMT